MFSSHSEETIDDLLAKYDEPSDPTCEAILHEIPQKLLSEKEANYVRALLNKSVQINQAVLRYAERSNFSLYDAPYCASGYYIEFYDSGGTYYACPSSKAPNELHKQLSARNSEILKPG